MGSTLLPLVDTHDIISAVNKLCHSWLHRPHHRQRYSQGLKTPAKWQAASLSSTCSSVLHFYPGFLNPLISWMKHTVLWTSISSLTFFILCLHASLWHVLEIKHLQLKTVIQLLHLGYIYEVITLILSSCWSIQRSTLSLFPFILFKMHHTAAYLCSEPPLIVVKLNKPKDSAIFPNTVQSIQNICKYMFCLHVYLLWKTLHSRNTVFG